MPSIETIVLVVTGGNALVLLLRPIPRIHARLDVLEARLAGIQRTIDKLCDRVYNQD